MTEAAAGWRRCSACKQPIPFESVYWTCNVSTCNRSRTALFFCSVSCWEVHLPGANHREAWAVEQRAPTRERAAADAAAAAQPRRRIARPAAPAPTAAPARTAAAGSTPREILIVASRLKDYIRAASGMSTSDRVLDPLSDLVREACDRAIENARRADRRTVLERDFG